MKFLKKRAVEGAHGVKAALKRAIGDTVLIVLHQKHGLLESYDRNILIDPDPKARFKIA